MSDTDFGRMSDVDGFTVVPGRNGRPEIHLLRPHKQCRVSGGRKIEGSRETLLTKLEDKRKPIECRHCFPRPTKMEEPTGEIAFADAE
jgi:hypothetical protein